MNRTSYLIIFVCLLASIMIGCLNAEESKQSVVTTSPTPAVTPATQPTPNSNSTPLSSRTFKSSKNNTYNIAVFEDDADRDEVQPSSETGAAATGDGYTGTARKAAKLSIANATIENFIDPKDLIESLPNTSSMTSHNPPITTDATSGRVQEENRNIRVKAFLYAASRENDNDFHLIIGRSPNATPKQYMTIEISGLPPNNSPSFQQLKDARNAFKVFFAADLPGSRYDFYDPPIEVEVEGSLFFDINHATGSRPGPSRLRNDMPVIWEVHPVSKITFEP